MEILKIISSIGGIAALGVIVVYYIDNYKITEIERKLMPLHKRIAYGFSFALINSIILFLIIILLTLLSQSSINKLGSIGLFVLIFITYLSSAVGIELFYNRKLKKTKFNIRLKESTDGWEIIRVTHSGGLLVYKDNVYKIIRNYENLPITMEEIVDEKN